MVNNLGGAFFGPPCGSLGWRAFINANDGEAPSFLGRPKSPSLSLCKGNQYWLHKSRPLETQPMSFETLSISFILRVPFVGNTSSSLELFNNFLLKAAEQGSARWVLGVNEALLAKAIGFEGRPTLSSPSSSPVGPPAVIDGSTGKAKAMPPLETLSSGSQSL